MLYYFFALLAAAVILLINNHRNETNRWAAFFLTSASIGGLSDWLTEQSLDGLLSAVTYLNHTLTPYGVFIFSVVYSELYPSPRVRRYFKAIGFIPVMSMLLWTSISPVPMNNFNLFLLLWAAPYYLFSCYLLLKSLWKEANRSKKRNRFVATVIIVPTLLAVLVLINVANVVSPDFHFFRYVSVFIIYSLTVALLCSFIYGVLGVKLRFERDPLESAMKAVSSGTTLLNHTIKNEIGKIAISSENLKANIADEESMQQLQIIANASEHMMAMVTRIHSQMKDIILHEAPCRLDVLVAECLEQHRQVLEARGIVFISSYCCHPVLLCDAVHMKEVMGNLLMNALEAMPGGGMMQISLDAIKQGVTLCIQDSGKGMTAEQLARVFEPFYSTKNQSRNFGLGLSYVYNVMQKSGGSVEMSSRENEGTLVKLYFSRKKILQMNQEERR
ncbi:sensor histidine kinase [Paenibacillus solisilvae]|uniref:histidine kinase n=1 Tax=Paenibacillus solisilvae TaxID=2486751 RepID=A0ABW0VWR6_9BACL